MSQSISFPLSSPQIQAAERAQTQIQNAGGNMQHALAGKAEKERLEHAQSVNETSGAENSGVDEEGNQGQEYEAEKKKDESSPDPDCQEADSASAEEPDEDDMQGRFINVVV